MKAAFFLLFTCTFWLAACTQQGASAEPVPTVTQHMLPVGRSAVVVQETRFADSLPYFFVHLHGNEITAADAVQTVAARKGIGLIRILNNGERLLHFQYSNRQYRFDPNRIFSNAGIRKTLALYNNEADEAITPLEQFRDSLLKLMDRSKTIIAVHNNTDNRFSILQYREAGMFPVHINAELDPDDFFLTNDVTLFERLKAGNFNVVLEVASKMEDDGSLSLYCSREGVRYVNVEAEHGHLQQQTMMLNALLQLLN